MIDLIEKIHELKDYENYDYDQAITDVEILLDQYNIITAPKTIKLSEIVKRINEFYKTNEYIVSKKNNKIYIHSKYESVLKSIVDINIERKIEDIPLYYLYDEFKWLYTLWIAGTIIEDDLQEDE